jgi:hypothetical protein
MTPTTLLDWPRPTGLLYALVRVAALLALAGTLFAWTVWTLSDSPLAWLVNFVLAVASALRVLSRRMDAWDQRWGLKPARSSPMGFVLAGFGVLNVSLAATIAVLAVGGAG